MSETDVPSIRIRSDVCKQDDLCTLLCPTRIFRPRDGEAPAIEHAEECVLCGQCVAGCPNNAIGHSGFGPERLRRIDRSLRTDPAAALALLSQRRSVRVYKPEPPRELLEEVLRVAAYAPGSPHHRVGWTRHFVAVVGRESMDRVRELTVEYVEQVHKMLRGAMMRLFAKVSPEAAAGVGVVPDLEMRLAEWREGRDAITYDAPAAIFAHAPLNSSLPQIDCDAALLTVILMAHAQGLGTCWNGLLQDAAAGAHLRGFTELRDLLGIPKGHRCYAAATIGYPGVKLHSVPERAVAIDWVGG